MARVVHRRLRYRGLTNLFELSTHSVYICSLHEYIFQALILTSKMGAARSKRYTCDMPDLDVILRRGCFVYRTRSMPIELDRELEDTWMVHIERDSTEQLSATSMWPSVYSKSAFECKLYMTVPWHCHDILGVLPQYTVHTSTSSAVMFCLLKHVNIHVLNASTNSELISIII